MVVQGSIIGVFVVVLAAFSVVPQIFAAVPPAACSRRCGDVEVPYPFGMEDDMEGQCYLALTEGYFIITCNDSFNPPKPFLGDLEIASISLSSARVTSLLPLSYDCYDDRPDSGRTWNTTLGYTYTFSSEENIFTAVGCDTLANFSIGRNNFGGCISGCNSLSDVDDGNCTGIGCCQGSIPRGVSDYVTGFIPRSNTRQTVQFNPCSYSFISQKGNYTFSKSDLKNMNKHRSFPVVLDFIIGDKTCDEAKADNSTYACVSSHSECVGSATGKGYVCNCTRGYQGNPYVQDGCQDVDECQSSRELYPCYGICTNVPGDYNCTCLDGYNADDPRKTKCKPIEKEKLPLAVKLTIGT